MNNNESIKVGDRIQKPVIKGYSTGVEEHIETFLVTEIVSLGKKSVLWAGGHMIATTDPRGDAHLGREDHKTYILPADYFMQPLEQGAGMLDVTKIKKVS